MATNANITGFIAQRNTGRATLNSFTHRKDTQCHINGLSFTDKLFFDLPITYPQAIVYIITILVYCLLYFILLYACL